MDRANLAPTNLIFGTSKMPSNSTEAKAAAKCDKVLKQAKRGKFLGKGAFGEVRDAGPYVIKTEKCRSGFRKRAKDFLPNIKHYYMALGRVIRAGMAPKVLNAYTCGETCVTVMQKVNPVTVGQALGLKNLDLEKKKEVLAIVYKQIAKMHKLLNVPYGHGDLHTNNIMMNYRGKKLYPVFIDFALERKLNRSYDWKFVRESAIDADPRLKDFVKQLEEKYAK